MNHLAVLCTWMALHGCTPTSTQPGQIDGPPADDTPGDMLAENDLPSDVLAIDLSGPLDGNTSDLAPFDGTQTDGWPEDSVTVDGTSAPDIPLDAELDDAELDDALTDSSIPGDLPFDADGVGAGCESFEHTIQPLFDTYCVQCHQGDDAALGLQLGKGDSLEALVNATSAYDPDLVLVVPGNAEASFLHQKLGPAPDHGITMPMLSPALDELDRLKIEAWINAGANENDYNCEGEDAGSPPEDILDDVDEEPDAAGPTEDIWPGDLLPEEDADTAQEDTKPFEDDTSEDDVGPDVGQDVSVLDAPNPDDVPEGDDVSLDVIDVSDTQTEDDLGPTLDAALDANDTASDVAEDDGWEAPTFPNEPSDANLAEATPAFVELVLETEVTGIESLSDGAMVLETVDGLVIYDATLEALNVEVGTIHEMVPYGEHQLVATDSGLFVLFKEMVLLPSPVNDVLEDTAVYDVAITTEQGGTETVWLATEDSLYRWEDGLIWEVGDDVLPTGNARLATGALYDDSNALWVASEGWLYAIFPDEGELSWAAVINELPVGNMEIDASGRIYLLVEGTLVLRHPDGSWDWLSFEEPITDIIAGIDSSDAWLLGENTLIHYIDDIFQPLSGVTGLNPVAFEGPGRFLAGKNGSVVRVFADEPEANVVTWEEDVEPIFDEKCAMCHSPNSIASDLSTMEYWMNQSATIVNRVKTDMPANDPPLDPNLTAIIEAWIDGGFAP